jgi:AcrR family transcriptional regulator
MVSTVKRRGRPKKLELGDVVETALAILDSDGIEAVSFRRLAGELGVSHMTLYTYFDSKESLLNAMVARTLEVPALGEPRSRRWDVRLEQAMKQIHSVLVERPGIAQLLVTHQFEGAWVGEVRERLLALLEPAGLGKQRTIDGMSSLFNYLFGTVMVESSRGLGGSATTFDFGLGLLIEGLRREAGVRKPRSAA